MKAVVTGASGFIGSELTAVLLKSGYEVLAIGRKRLSMLIESRQKKLSGSSYVCIDLDDTRSLSRAMVDHNFVGPKPVFFFHLAWGGAEKLSDFDVDAQCKNIIRTVNTYQVASKLAISRYIFCGSMEEAFADAYTKLDYRKDSQANRHVVYALAKVAARDALKAAYSSAAPDLLFATNSHVIGVEDDKDSFLQVALIKMLKKEAIEMTSGEQLFDVIHVNDCARAYQAIAERGKTSKSYWVGSGAPRPLRDYVLEMSAIHPKSKIHFGVVPFNDVILDACIFDTQELADDTSFKVKITFREAIEELSGTLVV